MKVTLFFPKKYSLQSSIEEALYTKNVECRSVDYRDSIANWRQRVNTQMFRFPEKARKVWDRDYFQMVNKNHINELEENRPDAILIYNNELFLPETIKYIIDKKIKVLFYLGDSPYYTPTNRYNLAILDLAKGIIVPDTFWQFQLRKTGIKNVHFTLPPLPSKGYYPISPMPTGSCSLKSADILYIGMSYKNAWGYKKAKYLSKFAAFDLKIYGDNSWEKWIMYFPELREAYIKQDRYLPTEVVNTLYNSSKIIPVDGNPGIHHGIHSRVLEALAAGTLPIAEWNRDMDYVFEDNLKMPFIKNYDQIHDVTKFFLEDDEIRINTIRRMQNLYNSKYNLETLGNLIVQLIQET